MVFFTFLLSIVVLLVWVFEIKATASFKYPAIFGFFTLTEYVAIPYTTMAIIYLMSFQYAQLSPYVWNYNVGLGVSVLILAIALLVKVGNKYIIPTNNK